MEERVFNFSPGPAMLPLPAIEQAQRELLALPGTGISILEISHRSKTFLGIIEAAEANLRKLLGIPETYKVLFLQGGALLQFAMAPLNILRGTGKSADYIVTGTWSQKASKEAAAAQGKISVAWDGKKSNYNYFPKNDELKLDPKAAYVYLASNETIQGVQFPVEPDTGGVPLVCDSSSDLLCRPIDIKKYGILFACAQKNIGPSGVTIVIIRDDLLEQSANDLPTMLSYKLLAEGKSLVNTPPTFAVYMVKLVTEWILKEFGDLQKMQLHNRKKADTLYDAIGKSGGFYQVHAAEGSRSLMNIAFRLQDDALEAKFLAGAKERNLVSLEGHRSVGGCRASIYNAMPLAGVELLAKYMTEFAKQNG